MRNRWSVIRKGGRTWGNIAGRLSRIEWQAAPALARLTRCALFHLLVAISLWQGVCAPLCAAQSEHAQCSDLLDQAHAFLEASEFGSMFDVAKQREDLCPGPVSSFLVGLALANLLDRNQIAPDDWQRSHGQALQALRVAVSSDLQAGWRTTAERWIAHLETLDPPAAGVPTAAGGSSIDIQEPEPAKPAAAPAEATAGPAARPFPWGPVIVGSISVALFAGALTVGLAGYNRENKLDDYVIAMCPTLDSMGRQVCSQQISEDVQQYITKESEAVDDLYDINKVLLVAGGVTAVAAVAWFLLLPDDEEPEAAQALRLTPQLGLGGAGSVWGVDMRLRY